MNKVFVLANKKSSQKYTEPYCTGLAFNENRLVKAITLLLKARSSVNREKACEEIAQ
jgi:hypothetical protein